MIPKPQATIATNTVPGQLNDDLGVGKRRNPTIL